MTSAICTLFEGNYHYGVGALANSLYRNGFRGTVYAGYRGILPPWAQPLVSTEYGSIFQVADGMTLHFIPLGTNYHLTNYKPDFMLSLLNGAAADTEAIFYFDPDITVTTPWSFFEEWIGAGVAVCEDVNSPLPLYHPRRAAWRNYFSGYGISLSPKEPWYVNGGFVGVHQRDFEFLSLWKRIQEAMADAIGGLEKSAFKNSLMAEDKLGPHFAFNRTDQDALNAAVEAAQMTISILPKSGMGFDYGMNVMYHALGSPKPWEPLRIGDILRGIGKSLSFSNFVENCSAPIQVLSEVTLRKMRAVHYISKLSTR